MRIGIFGGTFDPFHNGHLFAIKYAIENADLDKCLVVVSGDPWQKDNVVATSQQRLSWTNKICAENFEGSVEVDDREVRRSGPTYTVDTLEELHAEYIDDVLVLIVGQDVFEKMDSWKDVERVREYAEIFVIPRGVVKVSSSEIRAISKQNGSISGLVPEIIESEISEKSLYN